MKEQQGFIFIVTLCIAAIMSLLLLSSLQHVLLYQRAANQQEEADQRFYRLEHTARHLINARLGALSACIIKPTSSNQVIQHLLTSRGCSLAVGTTTYRYFIEDLGEHSCLVSRYKETTRSTHHFRFSLLSQPDAEHVPALVQIRVIKPAHSLSCVNELKYVALGISSWRYLESMDLARYNT